MNTIYETIYRKLYEVIPCLDELREAGKSRVAGLMDLNVDILLRQRKTTTIALSHHYKVNGDMVPDPDMDIRPYHDTEMAEALSYRDSYVYQAVYPRPGYVNPQLKKHLNSFLNQWLSNLIAQGHVIELLRVER